MLAGEPRVRENFSDAPRCTHGAIILSLNALASCASTDADLVLRAQNSPASISYGTPTADGTTAIVPVVTRWSGSASATIEVAVDVEQLKITAITCPM